MNLNLARKWRSKTFDQMIGQELPMSMLKNSLYSNYFMPVYLFSGQRGCGKTSAARLFAAAINCRALEKFRQNPKDQPLPCNQCDSCMAMRDGVHPDFIEIDAASNTGVDNIRTVIESATLLPTLSAKRIYLIDEVHMLSKAAFNAFLKILEEPPLTSLFILATTDLHKVLETVRSRSFQLFFKPISAPALTNHLAHICTQESIAYEMGALEKIAVYAEGSARDALNLLEQVRFAYQQVQLVGVHELLGILPDQEIAAILVHALQSDIDQLRARCAQLTLERYDASRLWQTICQLVRDSIFFVATGTPPAMRHELVATVARAATQNDMIDVFALVCAHEHLFLQARQPHHIIELVLCKIALRASTPGGTTQKRPVAVAPALQPVNARSETKEVSAIHSAIVSSAPADKQWSDFLQKIQLLDNKSLYPIISQATYEMFDAQTNTVRVSFGKNCLFFQDMLTSTQKTWQPLLDQSYEQSTTLLFSFDKEPAVTTATERTKAPDPIKQQPIPPKATPVQGAKQNSRFTSYGDNRMNAKRELPTRAVDVSDASKWPKAQLILSVFPGTIVESSGDTHA